MATWIPLDSNFPNHPKTRKLRHKLGDIAVLKLVELWLWASEFARDGTLPEDPEDIAAGIDLPDSIDAETFVKTLAAVGFLDRVDDGRLAIHDWHERFGRWEQKRSEKREGDRERQRRRRDRLRGHEDVTRDESVSHEMSRATSRTKEERRGDNKESVTSRVTKAGHPQVDEFGYETPEGGWNSGMTGDERPHRTWQHQQLVDEKAEQDRIAEILRRHPERAASGTPAATRAQEPAATPKAGLRARNVPDEISSRG